jgi:hypothetical protein
MRPQLPSNGSEPAQQQSLRRAIPTNLFNCYGIFASNLRTFQFSYAPEPSPATGKKDVVWFALNEDRPLFAFGGLWTEFKGDRAPSRSRSRGRTWSTAS